MEYVALIIIGIGIGIAGLLYYQQQKKKKADTRSAIEKASDAVKEEFGPKE